MQALRRKASLLLASALAIGLTTAPAPAQEENVKKVQQASAAVQALEKRLKALEAASDDLAKRLKASEDGRAALEKNLAGSEQARKTLETRIKTLNAAQTALLKQVSEASAGTGKKLSDRLDAEAAARAALEKKLADSEKARKSLESRLRTIHAAQLTVLNRLNAESSKRHEALSSRIEAGAAERQALMKSLRGMEKRLGSEMAAREEDRQMLTNLNKKTNRLGKRVKSAETAAGSRAEVVHADLQRVKRQLLHQGDSESKIAADAPEKRPFKEHAPYLGIVHEYLESGEGIRVRRIALRSPAHDSDLYRGDVIVRANGQPVRSSGVMRPRPIVSRWEKREAMPTYITEGLPGETVQLEYVRGGEKGVVKLRLSCQTCGERCPFTNAAGGE